MNGEHLKPGTQILTTDSKRTKMVPGKVISIYTKPNGKPSEDYYNVELEDGRKTVLKYGSKATPLSFEVVHENTGIRTNPDRKKLLEYKLRKLIREELSSADEREIVGLIFQTIKNKVGLGNAMNIAYDILDELLKEYQITPK